MKAVVAAFNQEKALVGALSVLTNLRMELFQALVDTECRYPLHTARLPGMGRRELLAAGAVFPPQAPRLGPVAAAGPVRGASAVPPPSQALQPTSRLQTRHRDWGQEDKRNYKIVTKRSLCCWAAAYSWKQTFAKFVPY